MSPISTGAQFASTLHQTFPESGERAAVGVGLAVQDDARAVVTRTRHNPSGTAVIRLIADANPVMSGQHDDAARLGSQRPNHFELFGQVRPGQLHIAVNEEVSSDPHISPEQACKAITRVDGA